MAELQEMTDIQLQVEVVVLEPQQDAKVFNISSGKLLNLGEDQISRESMELANSKLRVQPVRTIIPKIEEPISEMPREPIKPKNILETEDDPII